MRLSRLAAPALALAVALPVAALPGPVLAAPDRPTRTQVVDGRGDVWRVVERLGRRKPVRTVRAPGRRQNDVTVVRVIHTPSAVVVRFRLARLDRQPRRAGVPVVQLRMPATHVTAVGIIERRRANELLAFKTYSRAALNCPGATTRFRPARRGVEFRLPRACLGDPSWVRARVVELGFDRDRFRGKAKDVSTSYVDVAPGRGVRLRNALSKRAYAPLGSTVADGQPPIDELRSLPGAARGALDVLTGLGWR